MADFRVFDQFSGALARSGTAPVDMVALQACYVGEIPILIPEGLDSPITDDLATVRAKIAALTAED